MHYPLLTGLSKQAWETCLITSTAAVAWKKLLCMPSTTAHFGVTSGSGQPTLIPNSLCCLTLVTTWTMLILRTKVRSMWCFSQMVIWEMQKKRLYEGANFSHHDWIMFFRSQLRVKIRCNRKCLDRISLKKKSLVVQKGAILESSILPLPVYGDDGPGSSGPHPW